MLPAQHAGSWQDIQGLEQKGDETALSCDIWMMRLLCCACISALTTKRASSAASVSSDWVAAVLGAVVVSGQVSAAADVVRSHSQTRPNSASQRRDSPHQLSYLAWAPACLCGVRCMASMRRCLVCSCLLAVRAGADADVACAAVLLRRAAVRDGHRRACLGGHDARAGGPSWGDVIERCF